MCFPVANAKSSRKPPARSPPISSPSPWPATPTWTCRGLDLPEQDCSNSKTARFLRDSILVVSSSHHLILLLFHKIVSMCMTASHAKEGCANLWRWNGLGCVTASVPRIGPWGTSASMIAGNGWGLTKSAPRAQGRWNLFGPQSDWDVHYMLLLKMAMLLKVLQEDIWSC